MMGDNIYTNFVYKTKKITLFTLHQMLNLDPSPLSKEHWAKKTTPYKKLKKEKCRWFPNYVVAGGSYKYLNSNMFLVSQPVRKTNCPICLN